MGIGVDLARQAVWQRRLREFERSPETVGQFCDRMGLSVSSFYRWQRKLADLTKVEDRRTVRSETASSRATRSPKTRKTLTSPTSTSSRPSRDRVTPASSAASPAMSFLPIAITAAATQMEVLFANGTRVSVPCHDREIVRVVLSSLLAEGTTSTPREGERC